MGMGMAITQHTFYKPKIGETMEQARSKWIYHLIQNLSRKMNMKNPPPDEFINTSRKLLLGFSDNVIWIFFEEAPIEFKYFPKPAEIKQKLLDINVALKKRDLGMAKETKPLVYESHPWPNAVIGLIMGVDDPRGISPWGMQTLGIDETEALYLYDCWKRGEWENEWAKEIIAKHKTYKPKSFAYYE